MLYNKDKFQYDIISLIKGIRKQASEN